VSAWEVRRFWTEVLPVQVEGGYTVHLDGRPVRTPLKAPLVLPTMELAEAVAVEWQAQVGKVDPSAMPFTRTANSAIDKVAAQFAEVVATLAAYGKSDLLCYRAEGPPGLAARQALAWDPLLSWAASDLGAPLVTTVGVMHVDQPPESLATLNRLISTQSPFHVAAFHDLVAISGSLVLAFAVARMRITADLAWEASRIDETWQEEAWGEDEEAAEVAALKRAAFLHADRFYALCG
jgi:chaperone required for assembly of F1-ATPase